MRGLALAAIGVYQRYVSPYKGFCCAYRVHRGGASCSALGARVIRRHGLAAGGVLLRQRLRRCGEVHRHFHPTDERRPMAAQRGDCDLGLTPDCDGPCDGDRGGRGLRLSTVLECCDCCPCDGPERKRKDRRKRRT